MEEWRVIEEAPNYLVSSYGRVINGRTDRLIGPYRAVLNRYYWVVLSNNGAQFNRYVHRLVAQAFVIGEDKGLVVNHIDGDKTNNCEWNLEWVTQKENIHHAIELGLMGKSVRIVETGEIFSSLTQCAKSIGGSPSNISHCLNGRRESHKGYTFEWFN